MVGNKEETIEKPVDIISKQPKTPTFPFRRFLIRYNKIGVLDDADLVDRYLFENIKKPLIDWLFKILITSIPIFLVFCLLSFLNVLNNSFFFLIYLSFSIGVSILWYLIIEFIKDIKRCK